MAMHVLHARRLGAQIPRKGTPNALHFLLAKDDTLWQVQLGLVQLGFQQELLEALPPLQPEARSGRGHLPLASSSSIHV